MFDSTSLDGARRDCVAGDHRVHGLAQLDDGKSRLLCRYPYILWKKTARCQPSCRNKNLVKKSGVLHLEVAPFLVLVTNLAVDFFIAKT